MAHNSGIKSMDMKSAQTQSASYWNTGVRTFVLMLVGAFAVACSTPTPYQTTDNRGYGYSETRIEKNRFRVKFSGNSLTRRETVENYLLFRSAELTKMAGYDYFVFSTQATDEKTYYRSTFDGFPGYGHYYHGFDRYGRYGRYGGGVGTTVTTPVTQYTAYADIVMFKGSKNERDVKAFDADDVLNSLGPRIQRPPPPSS